MLFDLLLFVFLKPESFFFETKAVFVCARSIGVKGECGYIQMPLYVNGDLDKWLEPNAK